MYAILDILNVCHLRIIKISTYSSREGARTSRTTPHEFANTVIHVFHRFDSCILKNKRGMWLKLVYMK